MLKLKTSIEIDGKDFDFEIYQVDEGIITGFKFDKRIFRDMDKVKESLDLFIQLTKSDFLINKKKMKRLIKKNQN